LVLYCFLENIGYRQMTILWRLRGMRDYLKKKKGWDKFERIGFQSPAAKPPAPESQSSTPTAPLPQPQVPAGQA